MTSVDTLPADLWRLIAQGGVIMAPLLALAVLMFTTLFRLWHDMFRDGRRDHVADLEAARPEGENRVAFVQALQARRLAWHLHLNRRLRLARVLAGAAPLLGLLGTVTGMLRTFRGLSIRQSAETLDLVSRGISEALITTETGLAFGIAGLVVLHLLQERRDRLLERSERRENSLLLHDPEVRPC